MFVAAGAFLTDVDRFPWKGQSEFCVLRVTHKFKSLGFVCSPSVFPPHRRVSPFSRGVIFTRARFSLLRVLGQGFYKNQSARIFFIRAFSGCYAILTSPQKGETAVYGYNIPLCLEFFRCCVDVLQSEFSRSTALQYSACRI